MSLIKTQTYKSHKKDTDIWVTWRHSCVSIVNWMTSITLVTWVHRFIMWHDWLIWYYHSSAWYDITDSDDMSDCLIMRSCHSSDSYNINDSYNISDSFIMRHDWRIQTHLTDMTSVTRRPWATLLLCDITDSYDIITHLTDMTSTTLRTRLTEMKTLLICIIWQQLPLCQ